MYTQNVVLIDLLAGNFRSQQHGNSYEMKLFEICYVKAVKGLYSL